MMESNSADFAVEMGLNDLARRGAVELGHGWSVHGSVVGFESIQAHETWSIERRNLMGLDIVELVMAVEEEFQVQLYDDFGEIRTVGDLHECIFEATRVGAEKRQRGCPSLPPFFATRDALIAAAGIPKRDVRPSRKLSDLISRSRRREVWDQLVQQTGIRLPRLELSNGVFIGVLCAVLITDVGALLFLVANFGELAVPLGAIIGCVVTILAFWACRPFAVTIPRGCQTVGDIVRRTRPPQYAFQRTKKVGDSEQIWSKLVDIVSEQLDVPIGDITRDSRFIEDLRCG